MTTMYMRLYGSECWILTRENSWIQQESEIAFTQSTSTLQIDES